MYYDPETYRLTELKLAYAAGYFDGEGCLWMTRYKTKQKKEYFNLTVRVVSGDPASVSIFNELFGGGVWEAKHKGSRVKLTGWSVYGDGAVKVLIILAPFLKAKREQAKLVLESGCRFDHCGGAGKALPNDEVQRRMVLDEALRKAKKWNHKAA